MLLIFDGNHCLHRIMHTESREMRAADGTFTGGCYGVLRAINTALRLFHATKAVTIWDGKLSTRRQKLFPSYKDRPSSHDDDPTYGEDFDTARAQCQEILPHLGMGWLLLPDREADDVIAKAARYYRKKFDSGVVVVSEDKDLYQLIGNGIRVYRPTSDKTIYLGNFAEHVAHSTKSDHGCRPEEWVLLRAIDGDKSDCIDGVPQVGPKTVLSLMEEIRSEGPITPDQLMDAALSHPNPRARRIAAARDLITRNIDLMDLGREKFKKKEGDVIRGLVKAPRRFSTEEVVPRLRKWGMVSLLDEFTAWADPYRRLT